MFNYIYFPANILNESLNDSELFSLGFFFFFSIQVLEEIIDWRIKILVLIHECVIMTQFIFVAPHVRLCIYVCVCVRIMCVRFNIYTNTSV